MQGDEDDSDDDVSRSGRREGRLLRARGPCRRSTHRKDRPDANSLFPPPQDEAPAAVPAKKGGKPGPADSKEQPQECKQQ